MAGPAWATAGDTLSAERGYMRSVAMYAEVYYLYDLANPGNHRRPDFVYSHHRHNEFNLNLGLLQSEIATDRTRAALGLMTGTYAQTNLAHEPGVLQHLYEARIGAKLMPGHNLWLDAGVFTSHIGNESAIGKDCPTLTRSIMADNSPYYEAGARLTYSTADSTWTLGLLMLNGWQRITRLPGNNTPAAGHSLDYRSRSGKLTLHSASFAGSDSPDSARLMRYFHNLHIGLMLGKRWQLTAAFDAGIQQSRPGVSLFQHWYAASVVLSYIFSDKVNVAGRSEYYTDEYGVITGRELYPVPFAVIGHSLTANCRIGPQLLWRTEVKLLHSYKGALFNTEKNPANYNFSPATALAFTF